MPRDVCPVTFLTALILLLAQAAAPSSPAQTAASQNASPAKPVVQPSPESAHFTADVGIILVAVKATNIADYELVIRTLHEALSKDDDPARQAAAKGWRVYKADFNDAKGNPLYVHIMSPAVPGFDYRPSLLLDELVKDLAPELLSKYQESFAAPPTRSGPTSLNFTPAPTFVPTCVSCAAPRFSRYASTPVVA